MASQVRIVTAVASRRLEMFFFMGAFMWRGRELLCSSSRLKIAVFALISTVYRGGPYRTETDRKIIAKCIYELC